MKVSKKEIRKWIDALRSGEYPQTRNVLQDKKGYCCLGVACKVLVPDYHFGPFLLGALPTAEFGAPPWLVDINDDFYLRTGQALTGFNDGVIVSYSFNEIADLLQAVYIEGALD